LASSSKQGRPLAIPICFAFDGSRLYSSIDEKPKKTGPLALKRVSNIIENPNVCLVIDKYREDWRKLEYVLVIGHAVVTKRGQEFPRALALLRKKYKQYKSMKIEERPLIIIEPHRFITWKSSGTPATVKPKGYGRFKQALSEN